MLGGDRAHGPGPPRLERTSACAFAEHPADKLAHSLPGNSKHPGKLAPRPARQIVSTLRPSLSTMGNGEEDFSMKFQGTRSASAALALSPKSVGDPSGRNRPPVCGDDWSLENPVAGFGGRASPFFDVDNSGSPSNRPPATNFSATACAMLNSEKMRSRKPSSSSNPRWTEGAAAAGSLSGRHGATAALRPFVVASRTLPVLSPR